PATGVPKRGARRLPPRLNASLACPRSQVSQGHGSLSGMPAGAPVPKRPQTVFRPWRLSGRRAARLAAVLRSALELLLRDSLDVGGVDPPLVRLHDVAHEPPDLFRVGDAERAQTLPDERPHGSLVQPLRQVALAEPELEADLGDLGRRAVARLLEFGKRLLELLAVGADDVEDERVVDRAREALRGPPLREPSLDHAHDL